MTYYDDDPQTAMLLTDTEWKDLAEMLATYKSLWPEVLVNALDTGMLAEIKRRLALADRIIEAAG